VENNLHAFFPCNHIKRIWENLALLFSPTIKQKIVQADPWSKLTANFQGVSGHTKLIWKLIVSETVRAIWWKHTQKSIDNVILNNFLLNQHIKSNFILALNNHIQVLSITKRFNKLTPLLTWSLSNDIPSLRIVRGKFRFM
jgi:hypothetical protein